MRSTLKNSSASYALKTPLSKKETPQIGAETRRRVRIKSALTSETICLNKATMAFQVFQGVE
jgi:hypothetical protein